jgi:cytochrome o ubiquinol oxidase subunit I
MLFTMGFMVTFVIGGMTGVLLAVPPVDYLMHNTTFLVAHFHNMLIPGALFGYFAGYNYWFPKAMGFKLDETWGRRSFWAWIVGFYLAFMPLYLLGFLGMPRRMEHYDFPGWQPWLIIAALGACLIAAGLACQVMQLIVSVKNRRALAAGADPWDGRTLEWATASPPAPYNFAIVPQVTTLDAFWEMKKQPAMRQPFAYQEIFLPRNSFAGIAIGAFSFIFGFAMVWYVWWLAGAALLAIVAVIIARVFDERPPTRLSARDIDAFELGRT